eukprot:scaffold88508_cov39-Tisochrysis_lutea.AAC.1
MRGMQRHHSTIAVFYGAMPTPSPPRQSSLSPVAISLLIAISLIVICDIAHHDTANCDLPIAKLLVAIKHLKIWATHASGLYGSTHSRYSRMTS